MKTLVVLPMGAHPFHTGHMALYNSAKTAFPDSDVYIAATNDTSTRPFPFAVKQKLAKLSGVPENRFIPVKSPFRADEITKSYDPADTQLIFVRSEKDATKPPVAGAIKKDGTPAYLQPISDDMAPMTQHAYMAYLPTVEFGPGMTSATEIRSAWPTLNEKRKTALVMSLYPKTQSNPKLAATVVKMLDTAMGAESVDEDRNSTIPSADSELNAIKNYARRHYPNLAADPESAFDKWVQRSLMHSNVDDHEMDQKIRRMAAEIAGLKTKIQSLKQQANDSADYLDESR